MPSKTPRAVLERLSENEAIRLKDLSGRLAGTGSASALSASEMKEFQALTGGAWYDAVNPLAYSWGGLNASNRYAWSAVFPRYGRLKASVDQMIGELKSPDLQTPQTPVLIQQLQLFSAALDQEVGALQLAYTRNSSSSASFADMNRLEQFEAQFQGLYKAFTEFVAAARSFRPQVARYPPQATQAIAPPYQQPPFPQPFGPNFNPAQPQQLFSPPFVPQQQQLFSPPQPQQQIFSYQQLPQQQQFASAYGQNAFARDPLQQQYQEFLRQQQMQSDSLIAQQIAQQELLRNQAILYQQQQQQQPQQQQPLQVAELGPSPFGLPSAPPPPPPFQPLASAPLMGLNPPALASIGNQTIFADPDPRIDLFAATPGQIFA